MERLSGEGTESGDTGGPRTARWRRRGGGGRESAARAGPVPRQSLGLRQLPPRLRPQRRLALRSLGRRGEAFESHRRLPPRRRRTARSLPPHPRRHRRLRHAGRQPAFRRANLGSRGVPESAAGPAPSARGRAPGRLPERAAMNSASNVLRPVPRWVYAWTLGTGALTFVLLALG